MRSELGTVALDTLGVLRARGQDVVSFLQGQLSNDLSLLSPARALLAGYHNPQGRVIALLRLLQLAPDDVLVLLPHELIGAVSTRLGRFILRAKVKLADESALWRIEGLMADAAGPAAELHDVGGSALAAPVDATARNGATLIVRLAAQPARWLRVSAAHEPLPASRPAPDPLQWQRVGIAAGEPQVYAATSEEFVAQMINLDCVGAIAFDKGCYTGQEVIARAHYRGRVKRRMQRFVTAAARQLRPGDAGTLEDGRPFRVVDAVALEDGRCEFLAVAPLQAGSPAEATGGGAPPEPRLRLAARQLPLPYALPG